MENRPKVKCHVNFIEKSFKLIIETSSELSEVIVNYYGRKISVKEFQTVSSNSHSAEFSSKKFQRHPFEENYSATVWYSTVVSGKVVKLAAYYQFWVSIFRIFSILRLVKEQSSFVPKILEFR
jgi:hypothetical protein